MDRPGTGGAQSLASGTQKVFDYTSVFKKRFIAINTFYHLAGVEGCFCQSAAYVVVN